MSQFILTILHWATRKTKPRQKDEESASLLRNENQSLCNGQSQPSESGHNYGCVPSANPDSVEQSRSSDDKSKNGEKVGAIEPLEKNKSLWNYVRHFWIFVPYVWPHKNRRLQLNIAGVFICLLAGRFLKVLGPRQLGIVVNKLAPGNLPLWEILLYVFFNFVESSALLYSLKSYLWYPVEMNAYKTISTSAYDHIMSLSRDFHDEKKSGELYRAVEQGTSISGLLETVLFEFAPVITDLLVACGYLSYLFGGYMVLIVIGSTFSYLWATKYFVLKQVDMRRDRNAASREENQRLLDSVGGWVCVSHFNNFHYEKSRYIDAVVKALKLDWYCIRLHYLSNISTDSILQIGFIGACFTAAYKVSFGQSSVGTFVMLLSYWANFTSPLAHISYLQRNVQTQFIDAEQLLELLQTEPTVKSGPATFRLSEGAIDFNSAKFSYDGVKTVINDLSFSVASGQTVALVGETGSGKSTILNLLFRFYDVREGSIKIDGQDLRSVTLESLRQCIGVVPQDPLLFNDTIMNNVRYSKLEATDEEVMEACKAAAVHQQILSFTNGYASLVGENGVKLSGGEKQRIAIARAILKDPKIVLLDEATSSVDTHTEHQIQNALRELTQGRTTFIFAHRLSTVMEADVMLVIKNGSIIEQGSPKELLDAKGEFFELWSLQNIAVD